ncbi:MAG TPA: hypothetical protein VFE53_03035 [Mucilaginibacter sp.]|jgi:uncharacterized membrane protein YeaQ/YmgE (transglycosylase-associated protein family)|nr:hypothetical protein [Mucilaginibacter sp.]
MTHQHHKAEENHDKLFYIVGLLAGLFTGYVIGQGIILIVVLGIVGLLFAAFFLQLLVKGREDA